MALKPEFIGLMRYVRDTIYPCVTAINKEVTTMYQEIIAIRNTLFDVGVVSPVTIVPTLEDGTPGLPFVTYDPSVNKFTFGIPAGTVAEGMGIDDVVETLSAMYTYTVLAPDGITNIPPETGFIMFADETSMVYVKLDTGLNSGATDWSTGIAFSLADTFLSLTDTPVSFTGNEDRILSVSPAGDSITFVPRSEVANSGIQSYDELLIMETENDMADFIGRYVTGDTIPTTGLGDIIIYNDVIYKSLNNSNASLPPSAEYEAQDVIDRSNQFLRIKDGTADNDAITMSQLKEQAGVNILINGEVTRINQSGFTGVWTAGEYGYDGWLATTTAMRQIVEEENFEPETVYTLSGQGVSTQQITSPSAGQNWSLPEIARTARKIKLEKGSYATAYKKADLANDLMRCQRYYEELPAGVRGGHMWETNDDSYLLWQFKVTKASVPALTLPSVTGGSVNIYGTVSIQTAAFKIHSTANLTLTKTIADARLYS